MKTIFPSLLLLSLAPFAAAAETPASAKPERSPNGVSAKASEAKQGELKHARAEGEAVGHLRRLLAMSDDQLARSRSLIGKVENLSSTERAALLKRIDGLRDATPEARAEFAKEMREKLGLNAADFRPKDGSGQRGQVRNLLDKHCAAMAPEAAKAEREKFLAMPREEKVAYLKALREKYGLPEHAEGKGRKGEGPTCDENNPPPPPPRL